jgi:hypothetical protein
MAEQKQHSSDSTLSGWVSGYYASAGQRMGAGKSCPPKGGGEARSTIRTIAGRIRVSPNRSMITDLSHRYCRRLDHDDESFVIAEMRPASHA